MFTIIYKHYENVEIAPEMTITDELYKSLSLMFKPCAMYEMNCTMNGNVLHIRTKDKEEFGELCRLYGKAVQIDYELMKNIALNYDA